MAGSTWGEIFRISTWGESHGKGLGVVVDGCPAGLALSEEEIQKYLDKRKPGETRYSTPRKEGDKVEILSGVFEGKRQEPRFHLWFSILRRNPKIIRKLRKFTGRGMRIIRLTKNMDSVITVEAEDRPEEKRSDAWQPVRLR